MFIRLEKHYVGVKSGMKTFPPGEYNASDLPGGLAKYLVETEQALEIEGLSLPPVLPAAEVAPDLSSPVGPNGELGPLDSDGQRHPDDGEDELGLPDSTSESFESWSNSAIEDFAKRNEIELGGATKKADMIAVIAEWVELNAVDGVG